MLRIYFRFLGVFLGLLTIGIAGVAVYILVYTELNLVDIQDAFRSLDLFSVGLSSVIALSIVLPVCYKLWKRLTIWNTFGEIYLSDGEWKYPNAGFDVVGPARIGSQQYRSVSVRAHNQGVALRITYPILGYKVILIRWQEMTSIGFFPVSVNKNFGRENQGLATLRILAAPELDLILPWRERFATYIPASVGYSAESGVVGNAA